MVAYTAHKYPNNCVHVSGAVGGSGEESEGDEGGGEEAGVSLVAQQQQLEAEKEALLHNTGMVQEVSLSLSRLQRRWCERPVVWGVIGERSAGG